MTDTATTPATPAATKKTIADDMPQRRVFPTATEAAQFLAACAELYSDWGDDSIPFAAVGINENGELDPEIYNDSNDVMVAKLNKQKGGVKAIVVAPVPKIETVLDSDAGRAWLTRIMQKEFNHIAVRNLRDAENVSTVIDQMPVTLDNYLASGRDAGGGIIATFNELYKSIGATLASKVPLWAKQRIIKTDLRKALESKAYAEEYFGPLENYSAKGADDGLFVLALNLGINSAKRKGMDPTIFERWLATRNEKPFTPGVDEDEDSLDLDSLTDALLTEDEETPAEVPATEPAE